MDKVLMTIIVNCFFDVHCICFNVAYSTNTCSLHKGPQKGYE